MLLQESRRYYEKKVSGNRDRKRDRNRSGNLIVEREERYKEKNIVRREKKEEIKKEEIKKEEIKKEEIKKEEIKERRDKERRDKERRE